MAQKKRKRKRPDKDLFEETTMTFGEHLEELRSCLFKALLGLAIGFVLGLTVGGHVVEFIQIPLKKALTKYYVDQSLEEPQLEKLREAGYNIPPEGSDELEEWKATLAEKGMIFESVYIDLYEVLETLKEFGLVQEASLPSAEIAKSSGGREKKVPVTVYRSIDNDPRIKAKGFTAHEAFLIWIKASLVMGALLASPWIFYQIWSFVAAGLYPHEKKYIHVYLPFSLGLFLAGASLAFFMVLEPVLDFLFSFNSSLGIDPDPRISYWLNFVLVLPLGFGIAFQLPLVMLFLQRIGIFDVEIYLAKWRIAILVIAVISMFLTPADPYSMLLMAVPLTFLYFAGILLCRYMPSGRSPFDEWEEE
ncbi:MAG TPA: twin-arginine translocase subunit TatC [Thermoguttaceae bacterium]|nr:twin-arginine translocase subunit TatC [Thermoguttaceae bacterium]